MIELLLMGCKVMVSFIQHCIFSKNDLNNLTVSYHALSLSEGRDTSGTDVDDNIPSLLLIWHNAVASTSFPQIEDINTQC